MNESRQYRATWLAILNVPALYYLAYPVFFAMHYTAFKQGNMPSLWPTLLAGPIAAIVMVGAMVYMLRHRMPRSWRIAGLAANGIALLPCGFVSAFILWWIFGGGLVQT